MTTYHPGHLDSQWRRDHPAMHNGWQRNDDSWRIAGEPLEEDYMEDIVDLGTGWELKPVRHRADTFQDLIRSIEPWSQLGC